MNSELKLEYRRQFIHALAGSVFIAVAHFLNYLQAFIFSFGGLIVFVFFSYMISKKHKFPVIREFLDLYERNHETHFPYKGTLFYLVGVNILFLLFLLGIFQGKSIMIGALIVLAYGDAASTLVGKTFGKTQIEHLTLEGTLGGMVVSFALLSLYGFSFFPALNASLLGMMVEYLPLDDSISIPIFVSLALSLSL